MDNKIAQYQSLPNEMRALKNWVLWKLEQNPEPGKKPIKKPYQINGKSAESNNSETWFSFDQCLQKFEKSKKYDGIGFMFGNSGLIFIDLDNCIDNELLKPDAKQIVDAANTFTEISQSGKGLHLFFRKENFILEHGRKNTEKGYEIYDSGRYCAITGNIYQHYNTINENDSFLDDFMKAHFPEKSKPKNTVFSPPTLDFDDQEIIQKLQSEKNAAKFNSLYAGNWKSSYESQSNADLALVNKIAFYTQKQTQIDRIFQSSGLMRDKWSEKHGTKTYGEITIEKALATLSKTYEGKKGVVMIEAKKEIEQNPELAELDAFLAAVKNNLGKSDPQEQHPFSKEKKISTVFFCELLAKHKYSEISIKFLWKDYRLKDIFTDLTEKEIKQLVKEKKSLIKQERTNQNDNKPYFVDGKFKPGKFAEILIDTIGNELIFVREYFYKYNGKFWKLVPDSIIKGEIKQKLGNIDATSSRVADVFNLIAIDVAINKGNSFEFNTNPDLLNLKTHVLNIKTGELLPHNKVYYFDHILNVNWNPQAKNVRWNKFLEEIQLSKDTQKRLQEWFGYCLTRETKIEKCLYLKGEGANGKSKILQALSYLLGKDNVSALEPHEVCERFKITRLQGKLANIATDITKDAFTEEFKKIVSGEPVEAEYKGKDPFLFNPVAKHLFSSNSWLPSKDKSYGFFRRFDIIEFKRQFSERERDENLLDKLVAEIDGIFQWSCEGLKRLIKNHWKMTESKEMQKAHDQFSFAVNPVQQFIDEKWEKGDFENDQTTIKADIMRQEFNIWCDENNHKRLATNNLSTELFRLGFEKQRSKDDNRPVTNYKVPAKYRTREIKLPQNKDNTAENLDYEKLNENITWGDNFEESAN